MKTKWCPHNALVNQQNKMLLVIMTAAITNGASSDKIHSMMMQSLTESIEEGDNKCFADECSMWSGERCGLINY